MSAQDHLSPYQFKSYLDYPGKNQIRAFDSSGEEVGHFHWAKEPHGQLKAGEISHVEVNKDHQKKGLARHMYNMARGIGPEPLHSTNLSKSGRGFAKHVGGPWA
jgi:hypothetical protein